MNGLLVLAGGRGTRMKTKEPKALVPFLGVPMLEYMLRNVAHLFPRPYIVIGHRGDEIRDRLGANFNYILQKESLGTADAVLAAKSAFAGKSDPQNIVIIPGDHPLISTHSLEAVIQTHIAEDALLTLATAKVLDFNGPFRHFYNHGRIVRDSQGRIQKIVEKKDCTEEELRITEVNVSYYCFRSDWLWENIEKIENHNAADEYYLTDMVALTVEKIPHVAVHVLKNPFEGLGVNTLEELHDVEEIARTQLPLLDLV